MKRHMQRKTITKRHASSGTYPSGYNSPLVALYFAELITVIAKQIRMVNCSFEGDPQEKALNKQFHPKRYIL